jgi:signal transduction histidine kinase
MLSRGLAHDLKNLLTPVSSFLMHLDAHYPPDSAEAEAHGAARRSVRVMTDYVREALFFSERLEPRFETVDMGALIAAALAVAEPRAKARGVTLASSPDDGILIEADRVLLQRLLANVVGNAIDASKPDSEVAVIASTPEHGRVRLEVIDWGCGIESGSLEKIFEPYYTTKVFGEDVRGFGLGLAISRKIADLHGGKIRATSTLGRGTTITVDLPVVQPRTVRTARAA